MLKVFRTGFVLPITFTLRALGVLMWLGITWLHDRLHQQRGVQNR